MVKKVILYGLLALVVLFALVQLVPYGRSHTNPPVVKAATFDSPQTEALFNRACADCHSNNTNWRWYTNIAPFSWLIQRDVDEGRARLNYSECGVPRQRREFGGEGFRTSPTGGTPGAFRTGEGGFGEGGGDASNLILNGRMPPIQYTLIHPEARLTDAEKTALAQGLAASSCN
jgi:hypothetical protein